MRTSKILPVGLVVLAGAIAACADSGNPNASGASNGGGSSSSGDASGILGAAQDTYWSAKGDELVYDETRWGAIEAIADKSYPGTIYDSGNFAIPDVPTGPYWLALTGTPTENFPDAQLTRTFVEMDGREIDIGRTFTARSDVASMKQPTNLVLDATFTVPFKTYTEDENGQVIQPLTDDLQFVSRGAGLWGYADSFADFTAPMNGATQVQGWTFDMQSFFQSLVNLDVPLVDATKGDDFVMIHSSVEVEGDETPDGNPWTGHQYYSAKESASVADVTMVDGTPTNVVASFAPLTQKNFALDYKGSAFGALLPAGIVDPIGVTLSVIMEAGTPRPAVGTFANLWSVNVSTELAYTNPNPDCQGGGCDVGLCGGPCDLGMPVQPGDYAHEYMYGNPFQYGQELFSLVIGFSYNIRQILPEMTAERLRGSLTMQVPASEVNGKPIQPTLSLPQNIKVAGQVTTFSQITPGVGATPVVSWDAPAIGTPTHYRVSVIDLTDLMGLNGAVASRRTVATMETKGTQVTIPDGILKSGTNYYFLVAAYAVEGYDSSRPYVYSAHEATARMFTGVVTP